MNCPLEKREGSELLLDFLAGRISAEDTALVEAHLESCGACRYFVDRQLAVVSALDAWEAPEVSADFDRKLFARIAEPEGWSDRLARWLRPVLAYHGVPAAAATAALVVTAGLWMHQSTPKPAAPAPESAVVDVQPDQLEQALDAMDMLGEYSHKVRTDSDSKM